MSTDYHTKIHRGIGKSKFNKIISLFSSPGEVTNKKREDILGITDDDAKQKVNPAKTSKTTLQPENASFKEKVSMWKSKIERNSTHSNDDDPSDIHPSTKKEIISSIGDDIKKPGKTDKSTKPDRPHPRCHGSIFQFSRNLQDYFIMHKVHND